MAEDMAQIASTAANITIAFIAIYSLEIAKAFYPSPRTPF